MSIAGLGPHGERGAPFEQLDISEADAERARLACFRLCVVLHTTTSDWAKQALKGIAATLDVYGASLDEVVDCGFQIDTQIRALGRLTDSAPDAIISIPVGGSAVADAHRRVSRAGVKLALLDNGPTGLLPGSDYVSVISADNFGLGTIGARLLSPYIPPAGRVGILSYQADFFATNEREIAFRKWMGSERPDIRLSAIKFPDLGSLAAIFTAFLDANPDLAGLFAVWDLPAMEAVKVLAARGQCLPVTTVDLGNQAALALAAGDFIKGIAAQRAYDQGVAVAKATITSLLGRDPPSWIVLPGLATQKANVAEAYQRIWHEAPPAALCVPKAV
ncbi:substrate-binding domain-containing protein [Acidisoma cellulosilytica]|uniref:Substrate-binding domain-containing protein n=1 Tax=Acidisoma cellulosilyticum TaxID=2802395 RepID=A0A963Z1X2_9PROT|nr:substrate-binding domain-containing protein [Acidisoma cellulosilyticum]MCB8881323.1 substrate-binding domain-containing protein [Acidisoma cellulosilyticum]